MSILFQETDVSLLARSAEKELGIPTLNIEARYLDLDIFVTLFYTTQLGVKANWNLRRCP